MRAGKLDRTIVIQRISTTIDNYGVPVESWTNFAFLRAELVTRSATEVIGAVGAMTDTSVTFRTRWLAGVSLADRITFDGATYNIKSIIEVGRRRALEIVVERLG